MSTSIESSSAVQRGASRPDDPAADAAVRSKVALVTGTGGELGMAIARALAATGLRVVGLDIHPPGDPNGTTLHASYVCDLCDFVALQQTMERIRIEVGPVQVLVNNAAYYVPTPFFELTAAQIQTTLTVNVAAVLLLCQQAARQMIAAGSGGVIVNVASVAGRNGSSQIDYGASKVGVINLTTTLGRLLAEYGIRANGVAPALIRTGMGERLGPGVAERFLTMTPLKRSAEPAEIAQVVAFLCGPGAAYVNGTTIDIHGGL